MLGPQLAGLFGVFEPPRRRAGKIDDDQIGPAVAVKILCPRAEGIAVALRIVDRSLFDDRVHLPIRRFVPDKAGRDVQLAVFVEIPHGDPFTAKDRI